MIDARAVQSTERSVERIDGAVARERHPLGSCVALGRRGRDLSSFSTRISGGKTYLRRFSRRFLFTMRFTSAWEILMPPNLPMMP